MQSILNTLTMDLSLHELQRKGGASSTSPLLSPTQYLPDVFVTELRRVSLALTALLNVLYLTLSAAVLGISQGMADFLGPFGIRVNCVSPAVVASALQTEERRVRI
jgi:NAD(P)-dependent dehydrogenase (short-subunit alcohol dehydrogenase family)